MKLISIVLLCLLQMSCDNSTANADGYISFAVRKTELHIPSKYVLPRLPSAIVPDASRLDDGHAVALKIPVSDLLHDYVQATNEDVGLVSNILVLLSGPSEKSYGEDVIDAWSMSGLYGNRIIREDQNAGLYRIYPKAGYPKIWQYFNSRPGDTKAIDDSWVASCMVGPLDEERTDMSNVTCKSNVLYHAIKGQLTYSGLHVKHVDMFKEELKNMIDIWAGHGREEEGNETEKGEKGVGDNR